MRLSTQKEALIRQWQEFGIVKNKMVIEAFRAIPREYFVLPQFKKEAYADTPLPIQAGQTISQPTTVVQMLDALELKPGLKVLEVGAGSGYNAALIGYIVGKADESGKKGIVYSTELIPTLVKFAQRNIKKVKLDDVVKVIEWDGSKGYAKEAPYDRIIVTAAAPEIPKVYAEQLREGGILLIPVGVGVQQMIKAKKIKGNLVKEVLGEYLFVPLKGEYGVV